VIAAYWSELHYSVNPVGVPSPTDICAEMLETIICMQHTPERKKCALLCIISLLFFFI
jgi:hypothetical protein